MDTQTTYIVLFVVYSLLMIGIGVFGYKYTSGFTEFYAGSRRFGAIVTGLTAMATGRSAPSTVGWVGLAYIVGPSILWLAIGLLIFGPIMMMHLSRRYRHLAEHTDAISTPDVMSLRFDGQGFPTCRVMALGITIFFTVPFISCNLMGMGFAFKYLFNIPPLLGIFLSLCVVLVYVSIGGYSASMWVNTLQGALIALVFLISPFIVFSYTDWDIIEKAAMGVSGNYLSMMRLGLIWGLGMLIMGGVGYTNCPHVAQKWLTVKDPKLLKKAAVIDTIGSMACYFPGTLLGLTARIFFPTPDMLTGGIKDMAFFDVVGVIAPNPIFSGILVITMFAAMMSTADSMILTSSQAITYDFVAKVLGVKWNQRKINIFNRIITVLVGLAAFAIGIYTKWMLFYVGTFGWAGLGAALGLPLLFALYWRGTTKYGAIAGMISGLVATMAWGLSPLKKIVHEGGPGTIITIVVIVAVSLLTSSQEEKKKADEIIAMAKH